MAPASEPYRPDSAQETDLFAKIERLAELHKKGILHRKNSQPRRRSFSPGCESVVFEFDGPMRLEAAFDATAN